MGKSNKVIATIIALSVLISWSAPTAQQLLSSVSGKRIVIRVGRPVPVVAAAAVAAPDSAEQWSRDLAGLLGNQAPSPQLLALLVAWQRAEGSAAAFNPLATTQAMPGATCFNDSPCVKNYLSRQDGLQASVKTLLSGQPGYPQIVAGIMDNRPEMVLQGLAASPWGTSAALTGEVFAEELDRPAPGNTPIAIDGSDFGNNIAVALSANNGALRNVTIAPGATWSFNQAMGDPRVLDSRVVAGVDGGGWCDLAARYIQAARPLVGSSGLNFIQHGLQLNGVSWEDSVTIWNVDGTAGFGGGAQDLLIRNTTSRTLHLVVQQIDDNQVVVVGEAK